MRSTSRSIGRVFHATLKQHWSMFGAMLCRALSNWIQGWWHCWP